LPDDWHNPFNVLQRPLKKMHIGEQPQPVSSKYASHEAKALIQTFNKMAGAIIERETKLKEANDKLEETNVSLSHLNRNYMETLGFISHELKNPIATIMNYVYLIREQKVGSLTEKQKSAMTNINSNVRRILDMVHHYLNLSRIENDELEPVKTRVELLNEILIPLIESFEVAAGERKVRFLNTVANNIFLHADLNMTREIFENLISNAIKYGREGGLIRISAEVREDVVQCGVFNEGEGIAPENVPALFRKFSRLEEHKAARNQRGTGLGLFISKHIVEAHGGKIYAETRQGEGIEFIFTLPRYIEENTIDVNTIDVVLEKCQ
jgi:signal transduction histidine kinase